MSSSRIDAPSPVPRKGPICFNEAAMSSSRIGYCLLRPGSRLLRFNEAAMSSSRIGTHDLTLRRLWFRASMRPR